MRNAGGLLVVAAVSLGLAALLSSDFASARAEADSEYSKPQTYSAALRYLRVDLGYEIVERDPDAAYLLFRYSPAGRRGNPSHGSIEIIEAKDKVKLFVQLPQMPSYHEVVLRDGLLKKLRQEYGTPPKQPPQAPTKAPRDGGAD
jgi:hypothetical protein